MFWRKRCSLKISWNSQENICARVSFLKKFQAETCSWDLWHRCFPVNFVKFLRTSFLKNTSVWLLPTTGLHPRISDYQAQKSKILLKLEIYENYIFLSNRIRKTPTRKIPTNQTPSWWIPRRKIPIKKTSTHVFKYSYPRFKIFLFINVNIKNRSLL